ncbi:chemotaxis-specific protein-glutamate methyltransferase CheB [Azospirillum sp. SYSU D00513]|uniref:chemotaxis-specific protein-glutamate methyltransferase CheB n=1 Tax=Azospirillum sp. SYSU D00513 TaxID=2812561 RepID=UPI001A95B4D5|nr:chemotaxis-specific protein-glutamate methyltransferase CheB [Azospirillum sp. SYSU D00513]
MIKVLVVDDSALMRRRIAEILTDAGFNVTTAPSGADALERLAAVDPDVVTLDVEMPGMDGLTCLRRIMIEHPKPVVMLSALTAEGAGVTLEALRLGAVEAVQKPNSGPVRSLAGIAGELVDTVRAAASSRPRRTLGLRERLKQTRARIAGEDFVEPFAPAPKAGSPVGDPADGDGVVLVGVSTGGPRTLEDILPALPAAFPWPVVVAQHMPPAFTNTLAKRLDEICALHVTEVAMPMPLQPGTVYIARGGADVTLSKRGSQRLVMPMPAAPELHWHPSVDRLVESALRVVPPERLAGVLLTGMGSDGAAAMADLAARGGRTIAESEESCVVFGMPQELIRRGGATVTLPSERIADQLVRWIPVPRRR